MPRSLRRPLATFHDSDTYYMVVDKNAEAEFEAFVLRSGSSLLRTAMMLTADRGHAEDIVQTALERTARHWARLNREPEAYARRILVNAAVDRRRWLRSRVSEVPHVDALVVDAGESGTADTFTVVGLRDALLTGLRSLPARQRSVLVLRYFLDLDERATAAMLGISIGTVKSSASRGLAHLRLTATDLDLSNNNER